MLGKRRSRSKLLKKYILIDFFVVFLPIAICSVLYCISVQKDYVDKYLKTIVYSVNEKMWKLEARTRSFTSIAQQICLDKDFTPYHLNKMSYSSVDAVKRLKSFVVESSYFDDLVICLNNSEYVYTSGGTVSLDTFLHRTYQPGEGLSQEDVTNLFRSKDFGCTKEGQYLNSGAFRYNVVTYPLGKTPGNFYGTLVGIYADDWEEIFSAEISEKDKRLVLVCTGAMEMLYSQVPDSAAEEPELQRNLAELLMDWDGNREYCQFWLGGREYVGKIVHSELSGWYLVDMVDVGDVRGEMFQLQLPVLAGIFLSMLLLTFFLSVLLSMYNYMPIRKLYNLFDKKARDRQQDELKLLDEYIRNMLEEQGSMEERLSAGREISRMELIGRILRGSLDMDSQLAREKIADMGLHLDKRHMAAIVLKPIGEDMQDAKRKLYGDIARDWGFYLTEGVYKHYDAFLACMEEAEEIQEFAEWLAQRAGEADGFRVGIGNTYVNSERLKYSLMEGVIALESGKRTEGGLVFFSELAVCKESELYRRPLKSEQRLQQLLVQGRAEELEEALDELYGELLQIWQSAPEQVRTFLTNRIMADVFKDALCLEDGDGERYLQYSDMEDFFGQLRRFCQTEMNCRRKRKEVMEGGRMKEILDFIDQNYMSPGMSLVMVAGRFGMTGPWFSKIFKEAVGKTFLEYVTEKRLNLAADLLTRTDNPVGIIVAKVGYSDAASFTRKFSRHFLVSPGVYRKTQRQKCSGASEGKEGGDGV